MAFFAGTPSADAGPPGARGGSIRRPMRRGRSVAAAEPLRCNAPHDARGLATTEYALILLAAALVGLMVVAWATAGGGSARIGRLFNGVIDAVIDRV